MTRTRRLMFLALAALSALVAARLLRPPRAGGPMTQEAYVWQRAWTPAVRQAVGRDGPGYDRLVVLRAEISFDRGVPRVVRVPHSAADDAALGSAGVPVGLALRVGTYAGPFSADGEPAATIAAVAAGLVEESAAAGVPAAELQLDFDCPESKLDGYRSWVEAIRRSAGVPVVITALPSWLTRPAFKPLAESAGAYVLQVHSFQRPASPAARFALCDPPAALAAVERAGRLGVPFRVALPTYGYVVAFDAAGKFVGLSAEGPSPAWPAGSVLREARADPAELAGLVRDWAADRPAPMRGLLWYRLPNADDALNWPAPALAAVRAGREPRPALRVEVRRPEPTLALFDLVNDGEADAAVSAEIDLEWDGAALVAADALPPFERDGPGAGEINSQGPDLDRGGGRIRLRAGLVGAPPRLAPGGRRAAGWVRLSQDKEVRAHVVPIFP